MQSFAFILSALFALTAHAAPTTQKDANRVASRDYTEFCAVTEDVNFRSCPSTDCDVVETWSEGTEVAFGCRMEGSDDVYTYWVKTLDGNYAAEYYVDSDCTQYLYAC